MQTKEERIEQIFSYLWQRTIISIMHARKTLSILSLLRALQTATDSSLYSHAVNYFSACSNLASPAFRLLVIADAVVSLHLVRFLEDLLVLSVARAKMTIHFVLVSDTQR